MFLKVERDLAIDEQYSNKRAEAYLNIVDAQTSFVVCQQSSGSSGWRKLDPHADADER